MTKQISRFPIPEFSELPEDIQAIQNGVKEKLGFVPNVIKALSHRPEQLTQLENVEHYLKNT